MRLQPINLTLVHLIHLPDPVVAELEHLELGEGLQVLDLGDLVGHQVESLQVDQPVQALDNSENKNIDRRK